MKEYVFEENDAKPAATSCSWLPTDNNEFVIGYESSHLAFFDFRNGNVTHSVKIADSPINCLTANELQPVVAAGLDSGEVVLYDFKQKKTLWKIESEDKDASV